MKTLFRVVNHMLYKLNNHQKNFVYIFPLLFLLLTVTSIISGCSDATVQETVITETSIEETSSIAETTTSVIIKFTTTALNVRSGPGTEHSVLETL